LGTSERYFGHSVDRCSLTWARVSSAGIAVAVALIIIANTPAVLTDTLALAVAQIRVNAAATQPVPVTVVPSETMGEPVSTPKKAK
jgi:hypothetical protein